MKHLLFSVIAMLVAGPVVAFAQPQACGCYELNRRASGLQYASRYAQTNQYERQQLQQDSQNAFYVLNQSQQGYSTYQQEIMCSQENQRVNYNWVRWQPWVARNGADIGNPCE